jgi:alpha-L-fucosidase
METTPLILNDKLITITFERKDSYGTAILILDFESHQVLKRIPWNLGLGCAIKVQNLIYIFGSSDWNSQNYVGMIRLDQNLNLLDPVDYPHKILNATINQKIFNTSVAPDPNGYVMAYEVAEKGLVNFSIRFLKSSDLEHWEPIGTIFKPREYAACPSIRYWNGWYYILFLKTVQPARGKKLGKYVVFISRTQNFETFEDYQGNKHYPPQIQVLSPDGYPYEGVNNSDLDLVEFQQKVYFVYGDGDQQHWSNVRIALYLGTMGQFFEEFWPRLL